MADVLIDGPPVGAPKAPTGLEHDRGVSASAVREHTVPSPTRHLSHMLMATTVVAVLPLVLSLALRASGVISSGWLSLGLAMALSLAASGAGSAYWRKRGAHGEVLFSDLLVWGWIRRWRQERELADAARLLDLVNPGFTERGHPALNADESLSVDQHAQLLRQLAGALEGQDVYLNGHSRRVARHAAMIARGMGLPSDEVARVRAAAAVHDIGKLRTPKAILNKPGRLTDDEFEVIKRHPVDGAEMVAALGDPELTRIVRHHHERLDGAGYPGRLSGEEIPLGARIIAVADTFDAITSARPYRAAAPHQKAIDILRAEAGAQLDPEAVRAFLTYYSGSRPTVVWLIATSSVRRLVSWLSGDPAAAASLTASKVAAATAATAVIGAAAGVAPVPAVHRGVRPAATVRTVRTRPPSAAFTPPRPGSVTSVPAAANAQPHHPAKPTAAKSRRGSAGKAAARRRTRRGVPSQTHIRAAGNSSSSGRAQSSASQAAPVSAATQAPSQSTGAPSQTSAPGPGAANAVGGAPSQPAPASRSQGPSANGNAYGHTKPLGNGHGNGAANGHGDPSATAPAPTPGNSQSNSQSNSQGNSQGSGTAGGNGNGQGNGNGNAQATPTTTAPTATAPAATTPTATTPTATGNDASQGKGQGNGNGAASGKHG